MWKTKSGTVIDSDLGELATVVSWVVLGWVYVPEHIRHALSSSLSKPSLHTV